MSEVDTFESDTCYEMSSSTLLKTQLAKKIINIFLVVKF